MLDKKKPPDRSGGFFMSLPEKVDAPSPAAAPPSATASPAGPDPQSPPAATASPAPTPAATASGVGGRSGRGQGNGGESRQAEPIRSDGAKPIDHDHGGDGTDRNDAASQATAERTHALPEGSCPSNDCFCHSICPPPFHCPMDFALEQKKRDAELDQELADPDPSPVILLTFLSVPRPTCRRPGPN